MLGDVAPPPRAGGPSAGRDSPPPRLARRTAADAAAFLLPHLRPGMRLLDAGCGPGTITVGLAGAVQPGEVVGIDPDAGRLEQARDRKSTRLNSSHANISYAVFCLKKKKKSR